MGKVMPVEAVRALLQHTITRAKTTAYGWARDNKFSPAFVSLVLKGGTDAGGREPSERLCAAIGVRKFVSKLHGTTYEKERRK